MRAKATALNAALPAAGGGLLFLGGMNATKESHEHHELNKPAAVVALAGAGVMVYAIYRIKPSAAAALGAVLLTAGYVNEHRRRLSLPDLPIPGLTPGEVTS